MTLEHHATVEDPYAAVRESRDTASAVPQELTKRFFELMSGRDPLRAPLPDPRTVAHAFRNRVHDETPFRIVLRGEEAIRNADIVFANHQGPKTDDVGGVDEEEEEEDISKGKGGTEGLHAHLVLPPHTRYVLKNYLVNLPVWGLIKALARWDRKAVKSAFEQIGMALAFRKTKPIIVDRTTEKPKRETQAPERGKTPEERAMIRQRRRQPHREYVKSMRQERTRVAKEICRTVVKGRKSVMVYPEGTRSDDGKIQGFVSEFFESIVAEYLVPRLKTPGDIRIGILVSDVLSAFPDGVSKEGAAYNKPITLSGIAYDPATVLAALRKRMDGPNCPPLKPKEIKHFGRMMLMDVRSQMAKELAHILEKEKSIDRGAEVER